MPETTSTPQAGHSTRKIPILLRASAFTSPGLMLDCWFQFLVADPCPPQPFTNCLLGKTFAFLLAPSQNLENSFQPCEACQDAVCLVATIGLMFVVSCPWLQARSVALRRLGMPDLCALPALCAACTSKLRFPDQAALEHLRLLPSSASPQDNLHLAWYCPKNGAFALNRVGDAVCWLVESSTPTLVSQDDRQTVNTSQASAVSR